MTGVSCRRTAKGCPWVPNLARRSVAPRDMGRARCTSQCHGKLFNDFWAGEAGAVESVESASRVWSASRAETDQITIKGSWGRLEHRNNKFCAYSSAGDTCKGVVLLASLRTRSVPYDHAVFLGVNRWGI